MLRGRKADDWSNVKEVRKYTSKLIARAKESYYETLSRKLINPASGSKVFWSTFSKLVDSKKPLISPLLENRLFVSNFESKANLLNDYFITKCCVVETSSTLPQFVTDEIPTLQNCEMNRTKVFNHIRNLHSSK